MKTRIDLWEPHEYSYPLAYTFVPNVVALLHDDLQPNVAHQAIYNKKYKMYKTLRNLYMEQRRNKT